jgi:hypothetical protein
MYDTNPIHAYVHTFQHLIVIYKLTYTRFDDTLFRATQLSVLARMRCYPMAIFIGKGANAGEKGDY